MGQWVLSFVGLALVYAALGSLAVLLVAGALGRSVGRAGLPISVLPFLFSTLFFVFLTQHPFPDRAVLVCPVPWTTPQLQLFGFLETIGRLQRRDASLADWVGNVTVASMVMNFVVCAVIGVALAYAGSAHPVRLRTALGFGVGLTFFVETTQLTGLWGLYPCAYREFNVDDLILNALGVAVGFLTGRAIRARSIRRRAIGK